MEHKKIENVVFYDFESETGKRTQACIFYADGSVENVAREDGVIAARKLIQEKNLSGPIADYMNKKYIYSMSGEQFEKKFKRYLGKTGLSDTDLDRSIEGALNGSDVSREKPKKNLRKKEKKRSPKKRLGVFDRVTSLFTQNRIAKFLKRFLNTRGKKIAAFITAASLALTGCAAINNKKSADVKNNDTTTEAMADENGIVIIGESSFDELLQATTNELQKETMQKYSDVLDGFNGTFASGYLEEGKDIRAALSWDEVVALDLVYNNYSKEEIQSIFNGAELDATALSNAYKTGVLQLMGAHVIERRDNPVKMDELINSEEGKAFYQKYHEMFLQAKEATGQDQIDKVNAFYQELFKDFPISDEIREEGISHADPRDSLVSYKYSVVPMVAAAEMMFQNLEIDHTLSDKAIAYFNDLGICNYADQYIQKASLISTMTERDENNPSYEEFKNAKIAELQARGEYVIDDAHRELSELDAFQKWVNPVSISDYNSSNTESYATTSTYSYTTTSTESHTDYTTETEKIVTSDRDKAVEAVGEEEVKKAEEKVDKEIEKENKEQKEKAEQKASEKAEELQKQEDEKKEQLEQQVAQSDQDLQNKIDAANEQIDKNNEIAASQPSDSTETAQTDPVNESDFGDHNVDFDENHSDSQGNLDNSVQDITTDGTDSKTEADLPDPNQTGQEFDNQAPEYTPETNAPVNDGTFVDVTDTTTTVDTTTDTSQTESSTQQIEVPVENTSDQVIYEYEETVSAEEIADAIVEEMANNPIADEAGYVYTK